MWGMPRDASTLEVRGKLADVGLVGFARGSVVWEGDHIIRLILAPRDSKGLTNEIVSHTSACLRKIGCRCVLDENRDVANQKPVKLQCVNLSTDVDSHEPIDIMSVQWVGGYKKLCSERKQKEVGELLLRLNLDVVAGQESWEKEGKVIAVDGYTVMCVKRVESCFLHILVIISVILHAIHTKGISK